MTAKASAFVDRWLEKLASRKLLVWGTATYLAMTGQLASADWVIISAIYIGTQAVIDGIVKLRGYNG